MKRALVLCLLVFSACDIRLACNVQQGPQGSRGKDAGR